MNQFPLPAVRLLALRWLAAISIMFCAATTSVQAAKNDVTVPLGGKAISFTKDLVINSGSTRTIFPSTIYRYNLVATVKGRGGALGGLINQEVPLATALSKLGITAKQLPLGGRVTNPDTSGQLPLDLLRKKISKKITINGQLVPVVVNFTSEILSNGQISITAKFSSTNKTIDFGELVFMTGSSLTVSTAPLVDFKALGQLVAENAGSVTINVRRQGSIKWPASVTYTIKDGTALAGVDYTPHTDYPTTGTVSFEKLETLKTIKVDIINRSGVANGRKFTIELSAPSAGTALGANKVTAVSIAKVVVP